MQHVATLGWIGCTHREYPPSRASMVKRSSGDRTPTRADDVSIGELRLGFKDGIEALRVDRDSVPARLER